MEEECMGKEPMARLSLAPKSAVRLWSSPLPPLVEGQLITIFRI
jgi:hypothetical protein